MSGSYDEAAVAAAVEALAHINAVNGLVSRGSNSPLKYRFCPLCHVALVKVVKYRSTWRCPNCSVTISPNRRQKKK